MIAVRATGFVVAIELTYGDGSGMALQDDACSVV